MTGSMRRRRRIQNVKARINTSVNDYLPRCTIADPVTGRPCGRPTSRAAKQGLNAFVCRYHQQHKQRHGSPWCKSPSAILLRPYLTAAEALVRERGQDAFLSAAVFGLSDLMASAGPIEIATRLRGLPPANRAKIALARLREAAIKPERLVAIALAVHALIEDAPEKCHRIPDWRIVGIAKAAHRLASGTHKVWPVPQSDGSVKHIEMHVYPRSSGRVLRHLGEMIENGCELVIDRHLAAVIALKRAADVAV